MENERGPNINWWMYEDGWRTRGDLTLTGGCTIMVGEREGNERGTRGDLTLTGGCTIMVGEREGNERGPNINWWMYEDGWRTRGDLTLTGGCTRMVGEREGT